MAGHYQPKTVVRSEFTENLHNRFEYETSGRRAVGLIANRMQFNALAKNNQLRNEMKRHRQQRRSAPERLG